MSKSDETLQLSYLRSSDRSALRAVKSFFVYVAAFSILLWPPLLNGAPFLMPDSSTYLRGADAAAYKLTGRQTAWTGEFLAKWPEKPSPKSPPSAASPEQGDGRPIVLAGRSVYYGALLYLSYLLGSLWFVVALQSVLVVACIALTLKSFRKLQGRVARDSELLLIVTILALLTPVGYFVGFLMPDVTAAFAILATVHILVSWSSMKYVSRCFWLALLVTSLASHSSTLLIVGCAATVLAVVSPIKRLQLSYRSIFVVATAVLAGIILEAAFSLGVKAATGAAPVRPPFATARLVDDGPGYRYLRSHCPQSRFVLCNYVNRLPQPSDNILWERRRGVGLFSALPPSEARAIALEQNRFVLAVFLDQPLAVSKSALLAAVRQSKKLGLGEFNYDSGTKGHFAAKLPPSVLEDVEGSAAFEGDMPVRLVSAATLPITWLSILLIAWTAVIDRNRQTKTSTVAVIVFVMLLFNVAICGMLSTPHERYLMRVVWLLPLIAYCVLPPIGGVGMSQRNRARNPTASI